MSGVGEHSDQGAVTPAVADEVDAIIMAAERVAEAIRRDADQRAEERLRAAEEEARRYLEAARREAEALPAQLVTVRRARRQLEEALTALAAAERSPPERTDGDTVPGEAYRGSPYERAPERAGDPSEDAWPIGAPPVERSRPGLDGARLVATQMARAGSSRAEVEAHLERTFGLPGGDEVLDETFDGREGRIGSAQAGPA